MQAYKHLWLFLILLALAMSALAQCPQPAFSIPDTICINEGLTITNNTTGATRYEWDFCSGDLEGQPVLQPVTTLTSALIPTDVITIFDGTNWFGFVSSRDNNKILRLNFGSDLTNTPTTTDIGNPGNLLSRPEQMKIIKEGNSWIGLVVNSNNFVNDFSVVRLNFGNSLTNIPATARITALDTHLKAPRGIEIVDNNGVFYALIANSTNNVVTIARFGNSLTNTLNPVDIKNIVLPSASTGINAMSISVIKSCDQWYGLVASFNNKVYKLNFGPDLFAAPAVVELTITQSLSLSPVEVSLTHEQGNYYALLMHINGKVVELSFGQSLTNNAPVISNNFSLVGDFVGLELNRFGSGISLFTVDFQSNKVSKFTFPNNCSASQPTSSDQIPAGLKYSQGGLKKVDLVGYDGSENTGNTTGYVFVRPEVIADFTVNAQCENNLTTFTIVNAPIGNRIISQTWDFGDGTSGNGKSAEHTYTNSGTYNVTLTVEDVCGQMRTSTKSIIIYKHNTAGFNAPPIACSNNEVHFQDVSSAIDDEIKSWEWNFGDGKKLTQQNPVHIYTQSGNFSVSLIITGKSGCRQVITKNITIIEGAAVDFKVENACIDNTTYFTDQTIFATNTSLDTRFWDFGDGGTSDVANPSHKYAYTGEYNVILTITNNLGCTTTKIKKITIRKLPKADYTFSLACSGEPTDFTDVSSSTDGEIASWVWDFGDPVSATNNVSAQRNPSHIFSKPGTYQVKLKVYTKYGCADSTTQAITVLSSPGAAFAYQVDCQSKQVSFTDKSLSENNTIEQWYWDFGDGNTSQEKNPVYVFKNTGAFTVTLIVTSASRCSNSFSQIVNVVPLPVVDFEIIGNLCINNKLQFVDKTSVGKDSVVAWLWDFGSSGQSVQAQPEKIFTDTNMLNVPVSLTVTTVSGCTAMLNKYISLQPVPKVMFTHHAFSDLIPLQINFINTSDQAINQFVWKFGDGQESQEKNPVHTYQASGIYKVSLIAITDAGCEALFTKEITLSNVPDIFELKLEAITGVSNNNITSLQVSILNNSAKVLETLNIQTLVNGQQLFTETWIGILKPGQLVTYSYNLPLGILPDAVCVIIEDVVNNKTSNRQCIAIQEKFIALNPYPNPATDNVTIPFILPVTGTVEFAITDITGREIDTFKIDIPKKGFNEIVIQTKSWVAGMYLIRYIYQGRLYNKKLVINR